MNYTMEYIHETLKQTIQLLTEHKNGEWVRKEEADNDYRDMRKFQEKFIKADSELRSLKSDLLEKFSVERMEEVMKPFLWDENGYLIAKGCFDREISQAIYNLLKQILGV